jgi:hypothetical protein
MCVVSASEKVDARALARIHARIDIIAGVLLIHFSSCILSRSWRDSVGYILFMLVEE